MVSKNVRFARLHLTSRERDVLVRLLRGENERKVASGMRLMESTVHTHVRTIYRKYGVHSRSKLLAKFIPSLNF